MRNKKELQYRPQAFKCKTSQKVPAASPDYTPMTRKKNMSVDVKNRCD
jgi:hypothetical protein